MTKDTQSKNEVHHQTDLKRTFSEIREDVEKARSREDLTELYKKTAYMITMTHASPVVETDDQEMRSRRAITEEEFAKTVRVINEQAKKIGVEADYNEDWEKLASNGYETEGENILEAQNPTRIIKE